MTCRGKGGTKQTRAHRHIHTLPHPEALGPEIEEGAVNQCPFQAFLLLPWDGTRPATGPGDIYIQLMGYVGGVGHPKKLQGCSPFLSDARLAAVRRRSKEG